MENELDADKVLFLGAGQYSLKIIELSVL